MTLLFCSVHNPMNSLILACLCLCAVTSVTCSEGPSEKPENTGKYEFSVQVTQQIYTKILYAKSRIDCLGIRLLVAEFVSVCHQQQSSFKNKNTATRDTNTCLNNIYPCIHITL